jgi:hypothetical protein
MTTPTLAQLRSALRQEPPPQGSTQGAATVLVTEEDAAAALLAFREDRRLGVVRVRVGDEILGYLARSDAYSWFHAKTKNFGDYQHSVLMGDPRPDAHRLTMLACPESDCPDNPVVTMAYDPGEPPHCRIHGAVLSPRVIP